MCVCVWQLRYGGGGGPSQCYVNTFKSIEGVLGELGGED